MGQHSRWRRAADRRHAAQASLFVLVLIAAVLFSGVVERRAAEQRAATVAIHDTRTCAAVAVYTSSTADDWSQRAAIARANLNLFKAAGVPDCYPELVAILGDGLDEYRWQAALDAVDAVTSGSYALPLACERADTVIPLTAGRGGLPAAARSQCVINGLSFSETQA